MNELEAAISDRNAGKVLSILFSRSDDNFPVLNDGCNRETEWWDFKSGIPSGRADKESELGWANIASDLLAFHNNKGGVLLFGVDDSGKFVGVREQFDSKRFNDKVRRYLESRSAYGNERIDREWVE